MHMNPSRAALPAHSFAFFSPPGNEPLDGRSAIGPMATEHDFNVLRHAFRPSGGIARGDDLSRLLEDHLTKVGPPGFGRRADKGVNSLKRVYLAWALATVGDPKSAAFVREKTA